MASFIPLLDTNDPAILTVLSRIGPVIRPVPSIPDAQAELHNSLDISYILVDGSASPNHEVLISYLHHGSKKLIVPLAHRSAVIGYGQSQPILPLSDLA